MSEYRTILDEAKEVVINRQASYGTRERNFSDIAKLWSVILGTTVTADRVALCMIALKIARELFKPTRDNLVDICGYAQCLEDLIYAPTEEPVSGLTAAWRSDVRFAQFLPSTVGSGSD